MNPGWIAFFVAITGYCNGCLNLLNANFIPLRGFYYILILEGALTVAGNSRFPIFLRLTIWGLDENYSEEVFTTELVRDSERRPYDEGKPPSSR
jgi:Trk-type K+ transport system membrane component